MTTPTDPKIDDHPESGIAYVKVAPGTFRVSRWADICLIEHDARIDFAGTQPPIVKLVYRSRWGRLIRAPRLFVQIYKICRRPVATGRLVALRCAWCAAWRLIQGIKNERSD